MTAPQTENFLETFPKLRTWAVVGVSTDREKYGNKIFRDLLEAGYTVYAVNPRLTEVENKPCYSSVAQLPVIPDVVDIVVPPAVAEEVVEHCICAGVKRIWFQPGSESEDAIHKAEKAGIQVVHDACILIQRQEWN